MTKKYTFLSCQTFTDVIKDNTNILDNYRITPDVYKKDDCRSVIVGIFLTPRKIAGLIGVGLVLVVRVGVGVFFYPNEIICLPLAC